MNALIGYLQNLTWEINETLSILRWWIKINVTCSSFYETENDLLVRAGKVAPFICHCATVQVWFTPPVSFFIHYLLEMTISLVLTSDWLKVSLVTLEMVNIWGKRFTYSHCSLTNWENTSPVKFFNLLPCNPLQVLETLHHQYVRMYKSCSCSTEIVVWKKKKKTECEDRATERKRLLVPPSKFWPRPCKLIKQS